MPRGPSALRANAPARAAAAEAAPSASCAFFCAAAAASPPAAGGDDDEAKRRGAVVRSVRTLRSTVWRILCFNLLFFSRCCLLLGARVGERMKEGTLAVVVCVVVVRCGF